MGRRKRDDTATNVNCNLNPYNNLEGYQAITKSPAKASFSCCFHLWQELNWSLKKRTAILSKYVLTTIPPHLSQPVPFCIQCSISTYGSVLGQCITDYVVQLQVAVFFCV